MTAKLAKLHALSWPQRQVLLQALLLLPLVWAGLRAFGLSRVHRRVTRMPVAAGVSQVRIEPVAISKLVSVAANHGPFASTCLTRSLLLVWLLGRRGVRGELRIGVRRIEGGIESHAWVELEGTPIDDTLGVANRFTVFDAPLPTASGTFS